jgi:hypothetical protein
MMGGTALSGLGSLFGSRTQANAASSAGQMGWLGSFLAAQAADQGYQRASQALSPYSTAGQKSLDLLQSYLTGDAAQKAGIGGGGANLMSTFQPTQAQLEQTPGYQWARSQALGAMSNAGAARGLGTSGNLVQQIGQTATGMASQTFQQQLENYLKQNQTAYNMLYGPSQLGASAAGGIANAAMGAAGMIGQAATGAGTALGQGIMGAGNAAAQGTNALFGGLGSAASIPYFAANFGRQQPGSTGSPTAGAPAGLFDWFGTGTPTRQMNPMNYGPQLPGIGGY